MGEAVICITTSVRSTSNRSFLYERSLQPAFLCILFLLVLQDTMRDRSLSPPLTVVQRFQRPSSDLGSPLDPPSTPASQPASQPASIGGVIGTDHEYRSHRESRGIPLKYTVKWEHEEFFRCNDTAEMDLVRRNATATDCRCVNVFRLTEGRVVSNGRHLETSTCLIRALYIFVKVSLTSRQLDPAASPSYSNCPVPLQIMMIKTMRESIFLRRTLTLTRAGIFGGFWN